VTIFVKKSLFDSVPGKLFVGGLSWQTTPEKLKEYFGQFGSVTDVLVMKDPVTQVSSFKGMFPEIRKLLIGEKIKMEPHFSLFQRT
jgi:RNA recognition motif-containing protein